jgi:uncharacterized integral membrane protein
MIRKLVTTVILAPLAVCLTALAVANRRNVLISFDPFDASDPAFVLEPPLYVLILALVIGGVILGGTAAWLGQSKWRARARRLEAEAVRLRLENERLQRRGASGESSTAGLPVVDAPRLTMPPR